MRRGLRDVVTFAALTILVGACTVEDVKQTRSADSVAAATSKSPPTSVGAHVPAPATQTPVSGASAAGAPATSVTTSGAAVPADSTAASGAGGVATTAGGSSATGNLAPDSVDVG